MSFLASLLTPPRPAVAIDINARRVAALRLTDGAGPVVAAHAVEPLAPGVVVPGLNGPNVIDAAALADAVRRAAGQVSGGRRAAALVVPDAVAKVSLVRFEQVPSRPADFEALVRWQVRKSVPFRIDDAQVSWTPGGMADGAREFVVAVARRDLIEEYEQACRAAGLQPGLVDLATFNLVNAVLAAPSPPAGDWLLVHVDPQYLTLAIVRYDALIFYRHRGAEDGDESLADLVHQTAMYYEDRLGGGGIARVLLAGASGLPAESGAAVDSVRRQLEQRLGVRVDPVDPRAVASFSDRIGAGPELLDALAPLVGVLARERAA